MKAIRLLGFTGSLLRDSCLRLFVKGPRSAAIFLRVSLLNMAIRQRNKRPGADTAECPCCGWKGHRFYAIDVMRFWLPDVLCPECGAHERQRFLALYLQEKDGMLAAREGTVLHFAPEQQVCAIVEKNHRLQSFYSDVGFEAMRGEYSRGQGMVQNLESLGIGSETVDVVFCLHVLEHVRRDAQSIREIHRVLRPGGLAYIMVPFDMSLDATVEWDEPDPDVFYHIWAYSRFDFKKKLSPFEYEEIRPGSMLSEEERRRYAIPEKEIIYRCVKSIG